MSQFPRVGTPAATRRGHIRCGGAAYRPPHPTRVILVLAAFAGSAWLVSCGDSAVGPAPPPPPPPNRAPVPAGSIPTQTVAVGETAAVDVSAYFSDPDGDALSYTAETSDAGVAEGLGVGEYGDGVGRGPGLGDGDGDGHRSRRPHRHADC